MKKCSTFFILVVLLVVASMVLSACKQEQDGQNQKPTPTVETGWYWKPGGFVDYALNGMPDFDQKQGQWNSGAIVAAPQWSYCGPVAVANSMWWFDSKYEPKPVAPPTINDNYKLVESYSYNAAGSAQWDDHDINNVMPFVQDLAKRMDTDGQASGDGHSGTTVEDMSAAIEQYLKDKGLDGAFYVHVQKSPEFSWIAQEVKRCQDVVLLLGFWQLQTDPTHANGQWVRVGGHYVTCAGVNTQTTQIGLSDPYRDNAEAGKPGVVPAAHSYPHNSSVHNDAKYVSHDIFNVSKSTSPGGLWKFDNYSDDLAVSNFVGQNWAKDLLSYGGQYNPNLPVQVEIDYAIAVSPVETQLPTSTPPWIDPRTPTPSPTHTPTPTPTLTPMPRVTQTPTPTPVPSIVPDPSVGTVTGIHSVYRVNKSGGIDVDIHCIPAYFPNGTNIWDLHFFAGGQYLGSEYFGEPLVACTTYTFHVDTGKTAPECITIYLTDKNHKIWGQISSSLVAAAVPDITKTVITHLDNTQGWVLSLELSPEYYGKAGTLSSFFDLCIYTDEGCQYAPVGDWVSQSPLVSGETYSFVLDYSPKASLDSVFIKFQDSKLNLLGVAFSWPLPEEIILK